MRHAVAQILLGLGLLSPLLATVSASGQPLDGPVNPQVADEITAAAVVVTLLYIAVLVGIAAVGVVWMHRSRWFAMPARIGPPVASHGPKAAPLGFLDIAAGATVFFFSLAMAAMVVAAAGGTDDGFSAGSQLITQVLMFGPVVLYWFFRVTGVIGRGWLPRSDTDRPTAAEENRSGNGSGVSNGLAWLRAATLWPARGRAMRLTVTGLWVGLVGLSCAMLTMLVASQLGALLGHEPPRIAHEMLKEMLTSLEAGDLAPLLLMVFSACVMAPLLEEPIFRGLLLGACFEGTAGPSGSDDAGNPANPGARQASGRACVIGVSLLFALVHGGVSDPVAFPALFVLSIVFCLAYLHTASVYAVILAHGVFNVANVALTVLVLSGVE